jgi:hypothetical protein
MLLLVRSDLCNYGLYYNFCLNLHSQLTLNMLHLLDVLIPIDCPISRAVLVKTNPLGPTWLPSVQFDLLLSQLSMNGLVGAVDIGFYRALSR